MIQREPEEEQTINEDIRTDSEDAESLKQVLAEEKQKAESYLSNWQRAQADFVNYKRRSEQEKEETSKFANSVLISNLLPVLDDLERAFASMPQELAEQSWLDGIRLIERKLRATMEVQGLTSIKAVGEPFDSRFHEAVRYGEGREGIIIEELQRGYQLHDRILRPSMVVVGGGETSGEADSTRKQ